MKQEINKDLRLSQEERQILKQEIDVAWDELPFELKQFIAESYQQNLKTLYMLQDWARKNNHETMLELLSRKIAYKEEKLRKMESFLV